MRNALLLAMALSVAAQAAPSAQQEAFKAYLLSGKEPSVKDATWMTDSNLYVGMLDDGSRRDGFAEYLCMAAAERGVYPDLIKVVDYQKVLQEKSFVELGKTNCPPAASGGPTEVKF